MSSIEEIKNKISIVDVVSQYVRLEKSGKQYKARCPFHNEKTPSFYISPTRNTYHCFGCGVGGDIFKFLESIEHIEFKEALKILAERAGVSLEYNKDNVDNKLIDILREASLFYQINLKESLEAKKYLHDRGLIDNTISEFEIGYVKNDWRTLFIHLSSKGYSLEDIVDSGLIIKTDDGKYYDRFRGRIMFPIKNISGVVVGFTGRVLPVYDDGKTGKYVNTPETKLYHKSKILFNYDKAKRYIAESREVILCEGQMDVIMAYQSGIKNIIAVSGTAFTEDQVKIINRLADNVVLAFDNDVAGQKAADKAAIMCAYGGMRVYSVELKEKDIADMALNNRDQLVAVLQKSKSLIEGYAEKINTLTQDQKLNYIKTQVTPYLKAIQSPIERDFNINDFARLTSIDRESIKDELSKVVRNDDFDLKQIEVDNTSKNQISKKENLIYELYVLSKELNKDINSIYGLSSTELPEEIYNKKVLELENKDALNQEYYNETFNSYLLYILDNLYSQVKSNDNYGEEERIKKIVEINNIKNQYNKSRDMQKLQESIILLTNQLEEL
ncbi:MAG: primase [Patescibacteria group bacterium]|nr:primase [Patescibacteria group bacterium]